MRYTWDSPRGFDAANVYRDWFDTVYAPGDDGAFGFETVLVRLAKPIKDTLAWIAAQADNPAPASDFLIDGQERARIARLLAHPPDWAPDVMIHKRRSVAGFWGKYQDKFAYLPDGAGRPKLPRPSRPARMGAPLLAVIDDGVGYLNAQFTRTDTDGTRRTRLTRVWLQAQDQLEGTAMVCGEEVPAQAIDTLLAQGATFDEGAEYAAVNDRLYGRRDSPVWGGLTAGPGTDLAVTHGTHVADIAAGSDPLTPDAVSDCPMVAVQLPPQ
ncbi:MAG: hypothetical protein AAF761_10060, partial [Pseudomonadota bacterium]